MFARVLNTHRRLQLLFQFIGETPVQNQQELYLLLKLNKPLLLPTIN